MKQDIYFIVDQHSRIKIGWTRDIAGRLRNMQTATSSDLELLFNLPGSRAHEMALHERLKDHRVRGEWFFDCPAVRSCIEALKSGGFESIGLPPFKEKSVAPVEVADSDEKPSKLTQAFLEMFDPHRVDLAEARYIVARNERMRLERVFEDFKSGRITALRLRELAGLPTDGTMTAQDGAKS